MTTGNPQFPSKEPQPIVNNKEGIKSQKQEFFDRYKQVRDQSITMENIDTFIQGVLDSLIKLIEEVITNYVSETGKERGHGKDFEDEAFKYYDLPDLQSLLLSAQKKVSDLQEISDFIAVKVKHIDEVITPPDAVSSPFTPNNGGGLETPTFTPRLKTLLYILKDHGIDLQSISVTEGNISPEMYRKTSYVTVVVPELDRIVQVCDEDANASYVFKLSLVKVEEVNRMTKDEKKELIFSRPGLGARLVNRSFWRERLEENIFGEIQALSEKRPPEVQISGDIPRAAKGELDPWRGFWTDEKGSHWGSKGTIAKKLGKTAIIFKNRIPDPRLDVLQIADVFGRSQDSYSFEKLLEVYPSLKEEKRVETKGEWRGYWTDPETGKHWGPPTTLKNKLGVNRWLTVKRYAIKGNLKAINLIDVKGRNTEAYCYEEFLNIDQFLDFMTAPQVADQGEWSGFFIDNENQHWAPASVLAAYFKIDPQGLKKHVDKMNYVGKNVKTRLKEVQTAYCLESLKADKEFMEFINLPKADKEGPWAGFWTNPEDGKHWGKIRNVSDKLFIGYSKTYNIIHEPPEMVPKLLAAKEGKGIPAYCLEEVEKRLAK